MNQFEREFNRLFKPMSEAELRDYQKGKADCKQGKPHQDKSIAYTDGYAEQYEREASHASKYPR